MLDLKDFDAAKPMVVSRKMQINGHELPASTPIVVVDSESDQPGELTEEQAGRLWQNGIIINGNRALPTPVETPEQYAARTAEVDDLGKGKFLIRSPLLDEPVEVTEDKLVDRLAEVVSEGAAKHRALINDIGPDAAASVINGTDAFALIEDGSNGYYTITGPGLPEEGERVRGKTKAEERIAELRAAATTDTEVLEPTMPTDTVTNDASGGPQLSDAVMGQQPGSGDVVTE